MRYLLFVFFIGVSISAHTLSLRPDAPAYYRVKQGDTLWGIAQKYLYSPWEWPALWKANPRIKNPKHLYPGTELRLAYRGNKPYLNIASNEVVILSPHIRTQAIPDPIPAIPLADIKPFLDASRILDHNWLQSAPYVLAFMGEHLLGGQGDEIYIKNLFPSTPPAGTTFSYALYRPGSAYIRDNNLEKDNKENPPCLCPDPKELLGYMATLVGYAELVRGGDPAVIRLTNITEGIHLGDKVIPNTYPEFDLYFYPKAPDLPVRGRIIDLPTNHTQGAVGLFTVIDRGQDAGLVAGDVLAVYSPAHKIPDPTRFRKTITIPQERIGEIMIFRSFSKTSFALVVRSISAIHLMDIATNP